MVGVCMVLARTPHKKATWKRNEGLLVAHKEACEFA